MFILTVHAKFRILEIPDLYVGFIKCILEKSNPHTQDVPNILKSSTMSKLLA